LAKVFAETLDLLKFMNICIIDHMRPQLHKEINQYTHQRPGCDTRT